MNKNIVIGALLQYLTCFIFSHIHDLGSADASNSPKEQSNEKHNSKTMEKQKHKSLRRKHGDGGSEAVSGKKHKKDSSKDKRDEKKQSKMKIKDKHSLTKEKLGKDVHNNEKAEQIREARRQRRKKSKVL